MKAGKAGAVKKKLMMVGLLASIGWFGMTAVHSTGASAATAESLELLSIGKNYIGTPYVYGASGIWGTSFDCSSYTQFVFRQLGVSLPRTSSEQAYMGTKVDKAYLSVGDLVFFRTGSGWISHVAIYAGEGKILHASSSQGVTLSDMNSTYWKNAYVTARRIL
ncbi:C40 family peptidase [Cohnella fermenti]|uniref:C40 family peptidase n=1 Tax=Cohnella fermenti TaxID=2565925 RepID=UPI001E628ABE|nr:C40 family peptidase [Cohnella fermenti]